jgi:hypothetical protein
MPRNKVQFQKGMSLSQFLERYGTEAQCEAALFAWRWPQGFVCPECGHDGHCKGSVPICVQKPEPGYREGWSW